LLIAPTEGVDSGTREDVDVTFIETDDEELKVEEVVDVTIGEESEAENDDEELKVEEVVDVTMGEESEAEDDDEELKVEEVVDVTMGEESEAEDDDEELKVEEIVDATIGEESKAEDNDEELKLEEVCTTIKELLVGTTDGIKLYSSRRLPTLTAISYARLLDRWEE
jgi:hypothetical protein